MNKAWVIIPAAGVGKRMQSDVPKQYLKLGEKQKKTVIEHTLECFTHHPDIAGIIVALHPNDPYWSELTISSSVNSTINSTLSPTIPIHTVDGGQERADSVLNALVYLANHAPSEKDYVLVHDAARPCLTRQDIDKLLNTRDDAGKSGAILATPVRDTMKRGGNNGIDHTVDRENLWHALTPQMFPIGILTDALTTGLQQEANITDEASAIELIGGHPALIEGEASNIKITRPADLYLAEFFIQQKIKE